MLARECGRKAVPALPYRICRAILSEKNRLANWKMSVVQIIAREDETDRGPPR